MLPLPYAAWRPILQSVIAGIKTSTSGSEDWCHDYLTLEAISPANPSSTSLQAIGGVQYKDDPATDQDRSRDKAEHPLIVLSGKKHMHYFCSVFDSFPAKLREGLYISHPFPRHWLDEDWTWANCIFFPIYLNASFFLSLPPLKKFSPS